MTDKEVKHLKRRDLIELLCRMKKEEMMLKGQIAELQTRLEDRRLNTEKAGTLAEAMISVNGVLDATQKAADQYLEEIRNRHAELEKSGSEQMEKIREECARREEETDRKINAKWQEFEEKLECYSRTHEELEGLLGNRNESER